MLLPPKSTLFPYTTLFRSLVERTVNALIKRTAVQPSGGTLSRVLGLQPDRKSTRLNSSNSQISYAVFCLRKKRTISLTLNMFGTYFFPGTCADFRFIFP